MGSVDLAAVAPVVPGWTPEQVQNAATVIRAGQALGVPGRGLVIGVMTAMGESSLLVVDHGDAAGPDSRGLFQQRDNGAWGTYTDRMDPMTSATAFFRALLAVPGWEQLPPTIAAHRTQHNADPWHYARWWDAALALAGVVAGAPVPGIAPGTGAVACTAASPILRAAQGAWTSPADGPLTSGFGVRPNPTGGGSQLHAGVDLAPGCGAPIVAAGPGTVVRAGRERLRQPRGRRPRGRGADPLRAHDRRRDRGCCGPACRGRTATGPGRQRRGLHRVPPPP